MRKIRTQRRIPGLRRTPMGTAVDKQIEKRLQEEMRRWHVSRSFVIAHALAYTFNITIDVEDDYHKPALVRKASMR